jgi:hypothetical protein
MFHPEAYIAHLMIRHSTWLALQSEQRQRLSLCQSSGERQGTAESGRGRQDHLLLWASRHVGAVEPEDKSVPMRVMNPLAGTLPYFAQSCVSPSPRLHGSSISHLYICSSVPKSRLHSAIPHTKKSITSDIIHITSQSAIPPREAALPPVTNPPPSPVCSASYVNKTKEPPPNHRYPCVLASSYHTHNRHTRYTYRPKARITPNHILGTYTHRVYRS